MDSIRYWEILEQLSNWLLLKTDFSSGVRAGERWSE
jgi:hypothetical protein